MACSFSSVICSGSRARNRCRTAAVRRPLAAVVHLLQEAADAAADDDEPQAVVLGVLTGQVACAGPLDRLAHRAGAEIAVQHDETIPHTGGVGQIDNAIEHRLAVLAGGAVDHDAVIAGQVRDHRHILRRPHVAYSQDPVPIHSAAAISSNTTVPP